MEAIKKELCEYIVADNVLALRNYEEHKLLSYIFEVKKNIFHLAVEHRSHQILNYLCGDLHEVKKKCLAAKDANNQSPFELIAQDQALLELALVNDHVAIIKLYPNELLKKYKSSLTGGNIWHSLASCGSTDVLQHILTLSDFKDFGKFEEDDQQRTPVMCAIVNKKNFFVQEWLSNCRLDINLPNSQGITPLITAVKSKSLEMVVELEKLEVDVNRADSEGNTPLMHAVLLGSLDLVKQFIRNNIEIETEKTELSDLTLKNNKGETALFLAISNNQHEIAELLLSKIHFETLSDALRAFFHSIGEEFHGSDLAESFTVALRTAFDTKRYCFCRELFYFLKNNNVINKNNKLFVFYVLVNLSLIDELRYFLSTRVILGLKKKYTILLFQHGIPISLQKTAFELILESGRIEVLAWFFKTSFGAEITIKDIQEKILNEDNVLSEEMHKYLIKLYSDMKAKVLHGLIDKFLENKEIKVFEQELTSVVESGEYINTRNEDYLTPLMRMVVTPHKKAVEFLLTHKASVDDEDAHGQTVLHLIVAAGTEYLPLLLEQNNANHLCKDKYGNTILHVAVISNNYAAVEFLIKKFPEMVNLSNNEGLTPLHFAAKINAVNILKLLLDGNAKAWLADAHGNLPIHAVLSESNLENFVESNWIVYFKYVQSLLVRPGLTAKLECLQLLLNQPNVTLFCKNKLGNTVLHTAAFSNDYVAIEFLVKINPEVIDEPNNEDHRPLHCAVQVKALESIKQLLAMGANFRLPDKQGNLPMHMAVLNFAGSFEVLKALSQANESLKVPNKYGYTPLDIMHSWTLNKILPIDLENKIAKEYVQSNRLIADQFLHVIVKKMAELPQTETGSGRKLYQLAIKFIKCGADLKLKDEHGASAGEKLSIFIQESKSKGLNGVVGDEVHVMPNFEGINIEFLNYRVECFMEELAREAVNFEEDLLEIIKGNKFLRSYIDYIEMSDYKNLATDIIINIRDVLKVEKTSSLSFWSSISYSKIDDVTKLSIEKKIFAVVDSCLAEQPAIMDAVKEIFPEYDKIKTDYNRDLDIDDTWVKLDRKLEDLKALEVSDDYANNA